MCHEVVTSKSTILLIKNSQSEGPDPKSDILRRKKGTMLLERWAVSLSCLNSHAGLRQDLLSAEAKLFKPFLAGRNHRFDGDFEDEVFLVGPGNRKNSELWP